ncbi:MAG TPA: hypothetical protein ENJ18_11840 [Nannocystis exedens]|nr:hypothetical protein [Nannocystis exedens]
MLYVIDSKVPERARLDIFERVNGGVPLTRQQMRNCLYNGPATRFLQQEASTDLFRRATSGSLRQDTMRDREFVNRFCAFQILGADLYQGDMDDFLASVLNHMNRMSNDELDRLSEEFRTTLENNYRVFDKHAFRKHRRKQNRRSVVNASLWDIMSTGLSTVSPRIASARAEKIKDAFYVLQEDRRFIDAITYSPNDTKRVKYRFAAMKRLMQEVFDD